jgi:hypothetical protein
MTTRLIVLGLDTASPALIRWWADEGKLPAIRGLVERSVSGSVEGANGWLRPGEHVPEGFSPAAGPTSVPAAAPPPSRC